MNSSRSRRRSRGFTLIEAVVALVIMAGMGMALFSWLNASLVSLRRVETANARSDAMDNALEYMQAINPMTAPQGDARLGDYSIRWQSQPAAPISEGSDYPRGVGLFQIGLYDVDVQGARAGDAQWFELKLRLVGYKRVRATQGPL